MATVNLIDPSFDILTPISEHGIEELRMIENIGRTCYKSESKGTDKTEVFIKGLIARGHEAMLEHSNLSVKFVCDRGISHEIVRHREASFAQESTRYCNYASDKYQDCITYVKPHWYDNASYNTKMTFRKHLEACTNLYMYYINDVGMKPQDARAILPNVLKTEIVVTANFREWRHILNLRAADATGPAHPDMKDVMCPLLETLHDKINVVFDDIYERMIEK